MPDRLVHSSRRTSLRAGFDRLDPYGVRHFVVETVKSSGDLTLSFVENLSGTIAFNTHRCTFIGNHVFAEGEDQHPELEEDDPSCGLD